MSTVASQYLFKETRLNLEPKRPESRITITLPSHNSSLLSRPQGKRIVSPDSSVEFDENSFARKHLAADAGIFFRKLHRNPRNFLWRLLDERKILEVRSVDLSQDKQTKNEASLIVSFQFPSAIKPFGLCIAEPLDRDGIDIFALTTSLELFTLAIHKDFFTKAVTTEIDIDQWCRIFVPSSFGFKQPYRIFAKSSLELFLSLHDGSLMRLVRKPGDNGTTWRDTYFTEGRWSLRGLKLWKGTNTVRFGKSDLNITAAAAVGTSPDETHIFTVCLNHTLRAWNTINGKTGAWTDLLGENAKEPQKGLQYLIEPSQKSLMQILDVKGLSDEDQYYIVTYSPKHHQFKFWAVINADAAENGFRDVNPDLSLIPPVDELMNTTIWNLEEFYVKAKPGWKKTELWIRARSGPDSQVYQLEFDLFESTKVLRKVWTNGWVAVDPGPLTAENLRLDPDHPGDIDLQYEEIGSLSDSWMRFLFSPGRFTTPTLETALAVYSKIPRPDSNRSSISAKSKVPLKERMCSAILSNVNHRRESSGAITYELHEHSLATQWQIFYGLVKDLHKRRGEAIALVYDSVEEVPYVLLADFICCVRQGAEIEVLTKNSELFFQNATNTANSRLLRSLQDESSIGAAILLEAAGTFRKNLPSSFQRQLRLAIDLEIYQEPLHSVPARLRAFESRCNLCASVSDDDVNRLMDSLEPFGVFQQLTTEVFGDIFERLVEEEQGHKVKKDITHFGMMVLMRISQETLKLTHEVLLDLLVLVVFLSQDIEPAELSPEFDPFALFVALIVRLRDHAVLSWLANTYRTEPKKFNRIKNTTQDESSSDISVCYTMLETMCRDFSFDVLFKAGAQTQILTYWARVWVSAPLRQRSYEVMVTDIMGALITHGNLDLAYNFKRFIPENAVSTYWATYLKARLSLSVGNFAVAATLFKRSSHGLASGHFDVEQNDSSGLLDPDEKDHFSEGLSRYYQHVLGLFEKVKVYSYVAEFAHLALQGIIGPGVAIDEDLESDLLSRLFNALMHAAQYDEAYSALMRYSNVTLRNSDLAAFVTAMVQHCPDKLLSLPISSSITKVDATLASLARKATSSSLNWSLSYLLYIFRTKSGNLRGAASALFEGIHRAKAAHGANEYLQPDSTQAVSDAYRALINVMACMKPDEAWIFAEGTRKDEKRKVVLLDDVRKEYQAMLDQVEGVNEGRFAFLNGEGADMMDLS